MLLLALMNIHHGILKIQLVIKGGDNEMVMVGVHVQINITQKHICSQIFQWNEIKSICLKHIG